MGSPVERSAMIHAPVEAVWTALTDPSELVAWFGADVEIDPRPGGAVRFRWADGTERRGLIVDLDPPHRLAFRWRGIGWTGSAFGGPDVTVVTFTLRRDGDGTRLTVEEAPGVVGAEPRASAEAAR